MGADEAAATPRGASAGLHVMVSLPAGSDETAFTAEALATGVRVYPLTAYRASRRSVGPGLVLGYGPLTSARSAAGARVLGSLARSARAAT